VIRVERVSKRYGRTVALDGVSFAVGRGEVVGFVGPNGAGKSTTLRIITGFLDADEGRVMVDGREVAVERREARARLGYLPETAPLYPDMRVVEYLRFRARLKGVARGEVGGRVEAAMRQCAVEAVGRRLIGELSKGYRQRVGLADALVAAPPVLILDEPTAGLDPVQVRELRGLLRGLAGDFTVLLSSHALAEVEAVADRLVVIAGGRITGDGTLAELRAAAGLDEDSALEDVFVALTSGAGEAA
jgi:ABC-2 type transport system ATP-binding protein